MPRGAAKDWPVSHSAADEEVQHDSQDDADQHHRRDRRVEPNVATLEADVAWQTTQPGQLTRQQQHTAQGGEEYPYDHERSAEVAQRHVPAQFEQLAGRSSMSRRHGGLRGKAMRGNVDATAGEPSPVFRSD